MKKSSYLLPLAALGLGAVFVTAALASAGRPEPDNHQPRDRYACFDPAHVRNFEPVNDHKMIIVSDWNQAYELELGGVCIGIDTSTRIGIRSRGGGMMDICGPMDAEIFYSDLGGGRVQSCTVTNVRHLTGDEAAPYVVPSKTSDRTRQDRSE